MQACVTHYCGLLTHVRRRYQKTTKSKKGLGQANICSLAPAPARKCRKCRHNHRTTPRYVGTIQELKPLPVPSAEHSGRHQASAHAAQLELGGAYDPAADITCNPAPDPGFRAFPYACSPSCVHRASAPYMCMPPGVILALIPAEPKRGRYRHGEPQWRSRRYWRDCRRWWWCENRD